MTTGFIFVPISPCENENKSLEILQSKLKENVNFMMVYYLICFLLNPILLIIFFYDDVSQLIKDIRKSFS